MVYDLEEREYLKYRENTPLRLVKDPTKKQEGAKNISVRIITKIGLP